MSVTDVHLAVPASVGVEAGMVVLTEDQPPGRMLRIIIGQPEARAIMAAWQHSVPGRPSTWDLLLSTVDILGAQVDAAVITAVEEERHYYAILELSQDDDMRILSCRPSDAIALAVRAYNSTILADEAVLEAAGVLPDGSRPPPKAAAPGQAAAGAMDAVEAWPQDAAQRPDQAQPHDGAQLPGEVRPASQAPSPLESRPQDETAEPQPDTHPQGPTGG